MKRSSTGTREAQQHVAGLAVAPPWRGMGVAVTTDAVVQPPEKNTRELCIQ